MSKGFVPLSQWCRKMFLDTGTGNSGCKVADYYLAQSTKKVWHLCILLLLMHMAVAAACYGFIALGSDDICNAMAQKC